MADDLSTSKFLFAGVRVHCVVLEKQLLPLRPLVGGVVGQGWLVSPCYGGHSIEETPGSIPNPEAKLDCADGTALGRVWESRLLPTLHNFMFGPVGCGFIVCAPVGATQWNPTNRPNFYMSTR